MSRFTLLNTRPRHQAEGLAQQVKALGGEALMCPALRIEWLPLCDGAWQALLDARLWVVTSPNAVIGLRQALAFLSASPTNSALSALSSSLQNGSLQTIYPIGKATQRAIQTEWTAEFAKFPALQKALKNAKIPSPDQTIQNSEALLTQIRQTEQEGGKIALIKGKGGRTLLHTQLSAGSGEVQKMPRFHVEPIEVYRRHPAPFCETAWTAFRQASHPVLLASSAESWQNLKQAVLRSQGEADWQWAQQQPCLVFSQRIAQAIIQAGWTGKIWRTPPGDKYIIETLKSKFG